MTSVECGHRIGRYLTDVIEADYMSLHPLLPGLLSLLAAIGIEKWCMTVQSPSFPRLCGPRGRRTFHLPPQPDVPSFPAFTSPSFFYTTSIFLYTGSYIFTISYRDKSQGSSISGHRKLQLLLVKFTSKPSRNFLAI